MKRLIQILIGLIIVALFGWTLYTATDNYERKHVRKHQNETH